MAHGITGEEEQALDLAHYEIHSRIQVSSDPTAPYLQDGSLGLFEPATVLGYDPFLGATINYDLDSPVGTATVDLQLGQGAQSLSPFMHTPDATQDMFRPGAYFRIDVRCLGPAGSGIINENIPWRSIFWGRVDDADPAGKDGVLTLDCRDILADLMDEQIEPSESGEWKMGGTVIGQLLADLLDLSPFAGAYFRDHYEVLGNPNGLFITEYMQQPVKLLEALRSSALLNGWDLRGKWSNLAGGVDDFQLSYYNPDRALSGPQFTIGPNRYFDIQTMKISRSEVRNRVSVTPSNPPRAPILLVDVASQAQYGPLFLGVVEDAASRIRTPVQAQALATAILSDTSQPKVLLQLGTRLMPFVEINDVLNLQPNQVHHDVDMLLAVSGYTHTLTKGDGKTVLRTRDRPAAANAEWRAGTPKTRFISTDQPSGAAPEGAEWTWVGA